jgi:hypothetical protein
MLYFLHLIFSLSWLKKVNTEWMSYFFRCLFILVPASRSTYITVSNKNFLIINVHCSALEMQKRKKYPKILKTAHGAIFLNPPVCLKYSVFF